MNTGKCVCGEYYDDNSKHKRDCKIRKLIIENFLLENREKIIDCYTTYYSVSKIIRDITYNDQEILPRDKIVNTLKEENIYEGMYGENYLKKKVETTQSTLLEKYGVTNPSQLGNSGFIVTNKITYEKISYLDSDFQLYRSKVDKLSKKNAKNIIKPKHCYYTGILFVDEEHNAVNPNDPRKRTLDHRIPIIVCYLNNVSVEIASSLENLTYVTRYVNNVKGNTLEQSFIPIARKIRKVFIDAGYKSN